MSNLRIRVDGCYRTREQIAGSCVGCFNKILKDNDFCNTVSCIGYIWIKEEDMSDQKELELFLIEYLSNNVVEIEEEYYRARIDDVLPDIKGVLKHHPLKDIIIEAVKDCDIPDNGSNNIFVKAINRIFDKLGYR